MSDAAIEERKSARHTAGPWIAGRPDMATIVDGVDSKWIYAGDQYVAVASGRIDGDWHEVMANARLIAAAPDLLSACLNAIEIFGNDQHSGNKFYNGENSAIVRIKAAIAKAEGEA